MAVYDLTHTAAQIDETANKVLTTGEIAKMVRDEVKAQLSAITSGATSVPIFDSTDVMKSMTLANLAKYMNGLNPNGVVPSDFNADNITDNGVYIIYGSGSGTPTKYGILIVIRSTASGTYGYWGIQLFFTSNTLKFYFRVGLNGQSAYGNWSTGV